MNDREIQNRKIREIWADIARRTAGSPPEPCPDAEILSAYFAEMLGEAEKERWETHFSVCAACQQTLMALAAAEGAAPVSAAAPVALHESAQAANETTQSIITLPRRTSPRTLLRWLIPALAAAILLAVWLGVRKSDFLRPGPVEIAKNAPVVSPDNNSRDTNGEKRPNQQDSIAQAPSQTTAPAPSEQARQAASAAATNEQLQRVAPTDSRQKTPSPTTRSSSRSKLVIPKTSAKPRGGAGSAGSFNSTDALRAQSRTDSAAKPVRPVQSESPFLAARTPSILGATKENQILSVPAPTGEQSTKEKRSESAASPVQQRQVIPSEPQRVAQVQPSAQTQSGKALNQPDRLNKEVFESTAQTSEIRGKQQTARGLRTPAPDNAVRLAKQQMGIQVFAPDRQTFWIVGPVGTIERSTNGGVSVVTQSSGVLADLLSGSAPSPTVCWVVGRAGTILLTTDGAHWTRVGAPGDQDWIGVRAMDALHAVIWDKDQQNNFSTSDGGKTWIRMNP